MSEHHPRWLIVLTYTCLIVAWTAFAAIVVMWKLPLDHGPVGGIARVVATVSAVGYLLLARHTGGILRGEAELARIREVHLRDQLDASVRGYVDAAHEAGLERGFEIGYTARTADGWRLMGDS